MEIWKFIPHTNKCYQISNFGRVKRLHKQKWRKVFTILEGSFAGNGYRHHNISCNASTRTIYPHQLVAKLFIKGYRKGLQVNHKDGNKLNNHFANLEYVTPSQNKLHSYSIGTSPIGEKHGQAKLTEKQVIEIRKRWQKNPRNQRELASFYGITQRAIWQIIHRLCWKHI